MQQVLVVEDDSSITKMLRLHLERNGLAVITVRTLKEAREALPGAHFSAVLLDVNLPDGSGFDLCREIHEAQPSLPILMLTARTDERSVLTGLEGGAIDYIRKPFNPNELIARIRRFQNQEIGLSDMLRFGKLSMSASRQHATYDGREIGLTARELEILASLLRRPGEPVSRETILQIIDSDGEMNDRSLDSHMHNLRKKLKLTTNDAVRIATLYGIGYRLEGE